MIIDGCTKVWRADHRSDYLLQESHSVDQLLPAMDAAGVDLAVICPLGQQAANDYIAESVRHAPTRIIGFGEVNPRQPGAVEEIRRCAAMGLRGLKLHPTLHGYHVLDHALLDPIFRACADLGFLVLINALDDPFCGPLAIEEIARGFPAVPVLISHMGTVWNVMEALLVAKRTPNLFLETSSTQLGEVRMAYRTCGPEKLIMGSGWPTSDPDLERLKIARAIPDPFDRALVEGGTLARLLRLESPEPMRQPR